MLVNAILETMFPMETIATCLRYYGIFSSYRCIVNSLRVRQWNIAENQYLWSYKN